MVKMIPAAKRSYRFVSDSLWKIRINKVDKRQGLFIKQLRIISLSLKGFKEDNCLVAATALTFYTLFSIVPVLALAFAIAKGFGYEKVLQEQIMSNYSEYGDILKNAFVYADKLLSTTQGGVIAGFGIVLLLWSVMQLLINIENSFNNIWEVKRGRSWVRKLTDYLTIMMVGPLMLIVSGGLTVAVQARLGNLHMLDFASTFLIKILAYSIVAAMFTFLFIALPNTKVNYKAAVSAAIVSTILFELLGWGYIRFQIGANRMNAIYGGFAALPLFLIWVQYSWYIVLFGAELTYSAQNVDHYELEEDIQKLSVRYRRVIALMIGNLVAKRFFLGEPSLTIEQISSKLDLPSRLTRTIVNDFVETGIFSEVRTDNEKEVVYQPGVTESRFTVQFLVDSLEKKGVNSLPISDTIELIHINKLMQEMDRSMDTDLGHLQVKDIVKG
jgi:membrane protein